MIFAAIFVVSLLFGGAERFVQSIFLALISASAAYWVLVRLVLPPAPLWPSGRGLFVVPGVATLVLLSVVAFQIVPLPEFFASFTPILQHAREASDVLGEPITYYASANVHASRSSAILLIAVFTLLALAFDVGRDLDISVRMLKLIVWGQAILALYGLWVFGAGGATVLGLEKQTYLGDLTSTFANRNNYATFAGLGVVTAAGLIIAEVKHHIRFGSVRVFLASLINSISRCPFLFGSIIVIGFALLMTNSRGGIASTGIAVIVLFALQSKEMFRVSFLQRSLMIGFVVVFLGILMVGQAPIESRFEADTFLQDLGSRYEIYLLAGRMFKDYWVFGVGLGAFGDASFPYLDAAMLHDRVLARAHNSYLTLLVEVGLLASIAVFVGFGHLLRSLARGAVKAGGGSFVVKIACAATVLVGVHALVDFSLEILAVCSLYVVLLGVGLAQSVSSGRRRRRSNEGAGRGAALGDQAV